MMVAITAEADGVDQSPAVFRIQVPPPSVPAVVLIPFGPLFDCTTAAMLPASRETLGPSP